MNKGRVVLLSAMLLAACAPAHAVRLRYKFTKDETLNYKMLLAGASKAEIGGGTMRMEMNGSATMAQKVLEVDAAGTARVEVQVLNGTMKVKMGESEGTMPFPSQKSVVRVTARGKTTPVEGAESDQGGMTGPAGPEFDISEMAGAMEFPERDLKAGEKWRGTGKVRSTSLGEVTVNYAGTLVGFKNVRGRYCAVIKSTFEALLRFDKPTAQMPLTGTGKMVGTVWTYLDAQRGRDIETRAEMLYLHKGGAQMGEQNVEMNQTMKMNMRISLQQ